MNIPIGRYKLVEKREEYYIDKYNWQNTSQNIVK